MHPVVNCESVVFSSSVTCLPELPLLLLFKKEFADLRHDAVKHFAQRAHHRLSAGQPAVLHLHRLHQQMDLHELWLPQHDLNPHSLWSDLARTVHLSENGHFCPKEPPSTQDCVAGTELLWLCGLHQPLPTEQFHRNIPVGQNHDHTRHHHHPDHLLQEDVLHQD